MFLLFKEMFTANSKGQLDSSQSQNVGQKKIYRNPYPLAIELILR